LLGQAFPGVVGDKASVEAFVATVTSTFPDVKLLINNAGVMRDLDFTQAQLLSQDLTQEIRANLDGVIHMTAGYVGKKTRPSRWSR
jgi:short-subunit dehydrogenase involved in D-alanine esterification of teichoic acids